MSKTVKIIIGVIVGLVAAGILIVVGIMGCGIISAIAIPQFAKTKQKAEQAQMMKKAVNEAKPYKEMAIEKATEQAKTYRAKILQKTLENALLEYEAIEGKMPQRFDDFVLLYGELSGSYTYSFADLEDKITKPDSPKDLHMKKLEVVFKNGVEAVYYLNPPEITMTLEDDENENNYEETNNEDQDYEVEDNDEEINDDFDHELDDDNDNE